MKLSIVIPLYNEAKRIAIAVAALNDRLQGDLSNTEVIFVDDGSVDKTITNLKLAGPHFYYRIFSYQKNQGKGYALKQGVAKTSGDYVLFMDADMSTPLSELNKLGSDMNSQIPVIIGSRKMPGANVIKHQKPLRQKLGEGFTILSNILLVPGISDFTCGFKAFRNDAAKKIFGLQRIKRWGFDSEILFLAKKFGYEIKEIPVSWVNDERTKVNLLKDVWRSLLDLLQIRLYDATGKYGNRPNFSFYLYPAAWILLAVPTLINFPRLGWNYQFYHSYLTGDLNSLFINLANGAFMIAWFALILAGYLTILKNYQIIARAKLIVISIVSLFGAVLTVPFGSTDIFYYLGAAQGEIVSHINPYLGGFIKINPFYISRFGVNGPIMYPPLWLEINKVLWTLSSSLGLIGQVYFYKIVFAAALILTTFLIAKTLKNFKINSSAAFIFLLNPLIIFEFITNAHYDILMLLLISLGIYLLTKKKTIIGLTLIAISILIKYTAIVFLPFLVLYVIVDGLKRLRLTKTVLQIATAGFLSVIATVISFWPYWKNIGSQIFSGISLQSDWFINSLFSTIYSLVINLVVVTLGIPLPSILAKYLWLLLIAIGVGIILFALTKMVKVKINSQKVWLFKINTQMTMYLGLCSLAALVFMIFCQRSFWPWYATWPLLGIVFLDHESAIYKLSLIFSFSTLLFYIPAAFLGPDSLFPLNNLQVLYGAIIYLPPFVWLLFQKSPKRLG